MFWDLSVAWDSKKAPAFAELALRLGFAGVAYTVSLAGNQVLNLRSHRCPIEPRPVAAPQGPGPLWGAVAEDLGLKASGDLLQLRRLTLVVEDVPQVLAAAQASQIKPPAYDLVALRPTSEEAFRAACEKGTCDIISLQMDDKVPFQVRRKDAVAFLARGGFFELELAPALKDAGRRRAVVANMDQLLHATRGRNVLLSSAALDPMELRAPHDMANFAAVLGLRGPAARGCVSEVPLRALRHGVLRRGGCVQLVPNDGDTDMEDAELKICL